MPLFNFLSRGGPKKSQKANNEVLHDEIVQGVVANTSPTDFLEECTCGARKEELEITWEIHNFLMTLELSGKENSSLGNPAGVQKVFKKFESGKTVIYH
jgi:hypothetical protein